MVDISNREFADELRKWWSFDGGQMHTHSWHDRENFIERKLPELLARLAAKPADESDPDALNTKRAEEDARLAANVREAMIGECARVAYGFNAACNSPDMQPFVDADLVQTIYSRDFKIGDAILALSTTGEPKR